MSAAERFQNWMHAHGFRASFRFNVVFVSLQLIFCTVAITALVLHFTQ